MADKQKYPSEFLDKNCGDCAFATIDNRSEEAILCRHSAPWQSIHYEKSACPHFVQGGLLDMSKHKCVKCKQPLYEKDDDDRMISSIEWYLLPKECRDYCEGCAP